MFSDPFWHMADADEVVEVESHDGHGLVYLQQTARDRRNVFAALMEAVKEGLNNAL